MAPTDSASGGVTEEAPLLIELGPARVRGPAPGVAPPQRPDLACETVGRPRRGRSRIFIALAAWQAAGAHVAQDGARELGGILWGRPLHDPAGDFLEITEARPATSARGDVGQLTFGQEAWQEVLAGQNSDHLVVGWYHSHPGFGVFLSEQDSFIHRHFFARPWQVALVLDSVAGTWALYSWVKDQLAPWTGFELIAPLAQRGLLKEQAALARRARR